MTEAQVLSFVGSILLTYCAAVGTASVYVHSRVDWRATQMGRHVMYYMAAITLTLDLGVIRFLFGDSPWFQALRTVVFLGIPVVMTQRLYLLIRAQRRK